MSLPFIHFQTSLPSDNLVLSSRIKPIEETPTSTSEAGSTPIEAVLSLSGPDQKKRKRPGSAANIPSNSVTGNKSPKKKEAKDLSEYVGPSGEVKYAALIKDEIAEADERLLVDCKKQGQLGGEGF